MHRHAACVSKQHFALLQIALVPRSKRPVQTWKTFVRNHMEGIAAVDLFVVPTIAFQQLFAILVLRYERRQLLWFAVTRNPTAEWLARQITEAFLWDSAPKYLIRDNDRSIWHRVQGSGAGAKPPSLNSRVLMRVDQKNPSPAHLRSPRDVHWSS
jgi:hypothetical protein